MCYCPESLPPFTADLARCRLILQILALGLFLLSLFSILAGQYFFLFHGLMLSYLLYLSWARFDYILALYFFIISFIFGIMTYVLLIGTIQYYDKITGSDAPQILLLIAQLAYYPNAIFFSHYAYRHFKQWSINYVGNGGREYQMMQMGDYGRNMGENRGGERRDYGRGERREGGFVAFQGQAYALG